MIISCIGNIGIMTKRRRKRDLSLHQKRIRLLTAMAVALVLAAFAGLFYLINR